MAAPCSFFAQGSCAFGSACRFAHIASSKKTVQRKVQAPAREEQKVDPYDEEVCSFAKLEQKYAGQYDEQDLKEYWRNDMRPLVGDQLAAFLDKVDKGKRQVCKFFLKGGCTFGEACRNLHVVDVADLDKEDAPTRPTSGPSAFAESLNRMSPEADEELFGMPARPWPSSGVGSRAPIGPTRPGPSPIGPVGQGRKAAEMDDAECVICTESVRKNGERFGMLENCDHAFCLSCIRSWRKQREQQDRVNLRMCPLCRNESFFVIPSDRLILEPIEKARAIEDFKREMSVMPCKDFDYGRGKCSLGSSCFYAHLNPDGTRFIPAAPRKMQGAVGTMLVGDVKLCDFFD